MINMLYLCSICEEGYIWRHYGNENAADLLQIRTLHPFRLSRSLKAACARCASCRFTGLHYQTIYAQVQNMNSIGQW